MRRERLAMTVALALFVAGCASHSGPNANASTNPADRLASATVTFNSLQDGKDAKSAVNVQLLRGSEQLAADVMSSGTKFDDNAAAAPLALTLRGPFTRNDSKTGQLRLRLTPDGDDTWTFNVQLSLVFGDEHQQTYAWSDVRLDEKAPERTLVLATAQQ
jgi:hypothetical protein